MQLLFGSKVFELVGHCKAPVMVLCETSNIIEKGFERILLPVAPHDDFLKKVEAAADWIAEEGVISIYAIDKPGVGLDDDIQRNIEQTKAYLDEHGVSWEFLKEDADWFSVGNAQQTLDFMKKNHVDLVAIMGEVSETNRHFGKMDKESVILNPYGIATLLA